MKSNVSLKMLITNTKVGRNTKALVAGVSERMLNSVPECMEAVEAACKGWDPTRATFPETGALFFYSPKNMSEEAMLSRMGVKIHVIGNHDFHVDFNPDYAP